MIKQKSDPSPADRRARPRRSRPIRSRRAPGRTQPCRAHWSSVTGRSRGRNELGNMPAAAAMIALTCGRIERERCDAEGSHLGSHLLWSPARNHGRRCTKDALFAELFALDRTPTDRLERMTRKGSGVRVPYRPLGADQHLRGASRFASGVRVAGGEPLGEPFVHMAPPSTCSGAEDVAHCCGSGVERATGCVRVNPAPLGAIRPPLHVAERRVACAQPSALVPRKVVLLHRAPDRWLQSDGSADADLPDVDDHDRRAFAFRWVSDEVEDALTTGPESFE
jgi:hypothetical protein